MDFLKTRVLGYDVFSSDINKIKPGESLLIINTINAFSYVVAKSDTQFQKALKESDILLPDGFPIVTAARWLKGARIKKIAGADIFHYLCTYLNKEHGSCFFMGSSDEILSGISEQLKIDFPNLKAGFFSPPYRKEFSEEDNLKMMKEISAFKPDVLFVGMTAPKQEKWVYQNYRRMDARIICSIGAVFDFYAGSVSRPSAFWINMRMEWLIRLLKEPKRLWKRYLVYSPLFFIDLFLYKTGIKK